MSELSFSHANIAMTIRSSGRYIVWDRDTDVFGSGWTFPEALEELASNYPDDYQPNGGDA